MRRRAMASSARPLSISTCTTATARRISSGPTRACFIHRPTRCRFIPAPAPSGERGEFNTIVNAPLRAGDGGTQFRDAFETVILPRLRDFRPDILIISAGFDAHTRDPLANLNLVEADYTWVTQRLMDIANDSAQGRIVSDLEGGYDLQGPGALDRRACHRADAGLTRCQPAIDRHIRAGDERSGVRQ